MRSLSRATVIFLAWKKSATVENEERAKDSGRDVAIWVVSSLITHWIKRTRHLQSAVSTFFSTLLFSLSSVHILQVVRDCQGQATSRLQ